MTSALGYPMYDADQHYYEPKDAFTRYLPPEHRAVVRWVRSEDDRSHLLVNDKLFTMIANPTFDPVAKPGSLVDYLKARNTSGATGKAVTGRLERLRPEYLDRDARIAAMDRQGVRAALLLPTISLGFEELLWDNPPALAAVVHAGCEWLQDDWGLARDDRIVSAPMLSLVDPDAGVRELRWSLERGAKAVVLRPGPVRTPSGSRSPGDPLHDPFWALAAEAGVLVCYHAADGGYGRYAHDWGEHSVMETFAISPFVETLSLHLEKPIFDTMAAVICHGVLDRHPALKLAAIELGAGWVPDLLRRLKIAYGRIPRHFGKDPVEAFHEHVWVTPFHEQSIPEVLQTMRPERILFGSDWPHPEGVAEPADFAEEVAMLPADLQRRIMADNMRELLALP
jgi:predicted TIM-barrel fold metal-dependent hydrolase